MDEIRHGTGDDRPAGFSMDLKHTNVCASEIEKKRINYFVMKNIIAEVCYLFLSGATMFFSCSCSYSSSPAW